MSSLRAWVCSVLMALCLVSSAVGLRRELTTRSWDAMGFHENQPHSPTEDQIIIAVLDSGIWPESPSFRDENLGPPPAKWKGICDTGNSSIPFKCNNKIIGARAYYPEPEELAQMPGEERSPRDMTGHGSHVAAILAGVAVKNVSMNGVGLGTARGAVPRARIAAYKVCWGGACFWMGYGLVDAINDGADIISMSIGNWPWPYGTDGISPLTFSAMKAGLFISLGAGNNASTELYTVNNILPWVTTVGSSSGSGTDYVTYVTLGDGKRFEGVRLFTGDHGETMYPLVMNEDVTNTTDPDLVGVCVAEYMNPEAVKGKIVLCRSTPSQPQLRNYDPLGIAGLLIEGDQEYYNTMRESFSTPLKKTPAIIVQDSDYEHMVEYYKNSKKTSNPATANFAKTVNKADSQPHCSLHSGRGPSLIDANILKPDISAPGVNIISAVEGGYDAMSGTSMATPFVTGVAAYIKSFHPDWSPGYIKSALMTTATPMTDPFKNHSALAYGAGQVNPIAATDPGLVYDVRAQDYVKYLCQYGNASNQLVYNVTQSSDYDCAKIPIDKNWTLNFPNFPVPVVLDQPFVKVFQKTVTNVGNSSTSNYKAVVSAPKELTVKVEPSVLAFTKEGQSLSYTLTVEGVLPKINDTTTPILSASLEWTDGSHQVRSPIVVFEQHDMETQFLKSFGIAFPKD